MVFLFSTSLSLSLHQQPNITRIKPRSPKTFLAFSHVRIPCKLLNCAGFHNQCPHRPTLCTSGAVPVINSASRRSQEKKKERKKKSHLLCSLLKEVGAGHSIHQHQTSTSYYIRTYARADSSRPTPSTAQHMRCVEMGQEEASPLASTVGSPSWVRPVHGQGTHGAIHLSR